MSETKTQTPAVKSYDYSLFGEIENKPLSKIRKQIANNMLASWVHVPQVTHHDDVDISWVEQLRTQLNSQAAVHYTLMTFILKAVVDALKKFPEFNASLSSDSESLVIKQYYHLGIAVDTPEGLIVPVLKNADAMSLEELAVAITELADRARAGKLRMTDIEGGSFSVTSLGRYGGTGFTPIIKAPEVAILGVSRTIDRVVVRDGELVIRPILPLSLSYDHRAVDGAMAARFMTYLRENFEQKSDLFQIDRVRYQ